jgi:DNA polymerase/3'-5' exonuclease PolX
MRRDSALLIAQGLVEYLRPACTRIEIAGSIRRLKADVKDIEILAIPDLTPLPMPRAEFGKPVPKVHKTQIDALLHAMELAGDISLDKNGDRYKKFLFKPASIFVDLFLVLPPAQWGVQFVIRTGPAEFGHWLVTRKAKGGGLPNEYIVQDGVVGQRVRGEKGDERQGEISMPEEIDFLNFLELGWIEPRDRVARWNR